MVTIKLRRGKKTVKTFTATGKAGKNTFVFNKTVTRAAYTVQVLATDGTLRSAVVSRKLRLGR